MATHYRGTEREVRALNAYIKLTRASNTITEHVHRHLADTKLSISQFGILEVLHHLGPLPQHEIAKKLLRTGGNITMVVNNLEKRGLAERKRSPEDRRRVIVHLTAEGKRLVQEIFPRHAKQIARAMENLSAKEQEELGRLCKKLGRAVQEKTTERTEDST